MKKMFKIENIIKGHPDDLKVLSHYFKTACSDYNDSSDSLDFVIEFDDQNLSSLVVPKNEKQELDFLRYRGELSALMEDLKSIIDGVISLITGGTFEFIKIVESTLIATEDEDALYQLKDHKYRPYYRSFFISKSFKHSNTDGTAILLKAMHDHDLKKVLKLLSHSYNPSYEWNWNDLYAAWENIESYIIGTEKIEDTKEKKKLRKSICEKLGVDYKEIELFCDMANFSRRPEEGIRHGGGKIPKVKPLGYYVQDSKFGFDIIRRTVIQWIKQY